PRRPEDLQHVDRQLHPVRRERDRRQRALQRQHPGERLGDHRLHRHVHQQRRPADQLRGQWHRVHQLGGSVSIRLTYRRALSAAAALAALALSAAGLAALSGPALAADTATINGATTFQTMAGFGASEGFGEAATVMNASAAVQQQALGLLYSPSSYATLASTGSDQGQLWFAQQIKADYGVTNVFADAWSAPGFMKTNNSAVNGGTLCGVPSATCSSGDWRQAYANYLVQYAKDYAAAGDPLSYIGPENEANLAPSYDGMVLSPSQTANFL